MKKFIQGLAFGSVVGGVVGLLFAPAKGAETKRKWQQELDDSIKLTDDLNDSLQNFKTSLSTLRQTSQEVVPVIKEETKKTLNSFKFQATPRVTEITKQVDKIKNQIQK